MVSAFGLFIIALIIWVLFIKGALFRLLLAVFAFIGLHNVLWDNFPDSQHLFISSWGMTYATLLPLILIVLAMATTSVKDD